MSLNRVTIIVGPTGSGKSTQIPQLLLELKGRILCSQPRRLAVVAIAKRVADERHVIVGGTQVGYQVGSKNLSTKKTQILFTTAGILLEELRNNGVQALLKFRCVIIDECHERSPESDLVLALVRRFMKTHPKETIRVVLMSATFDHKRYVSYFKGVPGCGTIDTITLETAESFDAFHQQVSTYYLDTLPLPETVRKPHAAFIRNMIKRPDDDIRADDGKSLSDDMLSLIRTLVSTLDEQEPPSAPFLIFAPTYRHLEQIYTMIDILNGKLTALSVLHSAVDIEDCIRTMSTSHHAHRRRILLASAIADSSVTIPGVTAVIDLCRSLQVKWDVETRSHTPRTVWCSQSIANQRKGRTGRTCPGRVFRLVSSTFFLQRLEEWEVPQLAISDCHNEVLAIVTANEKVQMNDPRELMKECLDPPSDDVLDDAIQYLQEIGACIETRDGFFSTPSKLFRNNVQIKPTKYGSIMAALPMNVKESRIVLEGARIGMLHETLALMALYNHRPFPIVHHFSESEKNYSTLSKFYPDVQSNMAPSVALANLAAYMFWDMHWNHGYNLRRLSEYRKLGMESSSNGGSDDPWHWTEETDEEHVAWCKANDVNPTSMRSIKEIIENSMNVFYLHRFEPEWLESCHQTPRWKSRDCLRSKHNAANPRDTLQLVYGSKLSFLVETLTTLVTSRSAPTALPSALALLGISSGVKQKKRGPTACIHFLMGNCIYGSECRNAHSYTAPRPPCRFYLSGGCSKGSKCIYAHSESEEDENTSPSADAEPGSMFSLVPRLVEYMDVENWFLGNARTLVLLGEGNFQFTKALVAMGATPFLTSTYTPPRTRTVSNGLVGIDATKLHLNRQITQLLERSPKMMKHFAWNFPFAGGLDDDENQSHHEALVLKTFQSLVLLFDNMPETKISFGITLQGDQFSRWNVTRSAWRTNWSLAGFSHFYHDDFEGYRPCRQNEDTFPVEQARFYVFTQTVGGHH